MLVLILIVLLAAALGVGAWFALNHFNVALEASRRDGQRLAVEAEKAFDAVFNDSPVGYQDIDIHGNIIRVNQKEVTLRGLSREEMLGKKCWDLYPEAHRRKIRDEIDRKVRGTMSLVPHQRNYLRPDGKMLTLEMHEIVLRDPSGEPFGLRSAAIDMTEPTKKQEAVWQATSELNAVFMAFPDLFLRLDNQGTVLSYRAPNVSEFFGPVEELTGVSLDTLLPADVAESLRQAAGKALKGGHLVSVEYSLERASLWGAGKVRHFEARLIPLHWNEVVAIVREITERKESEQRLAQYAAELKAKNQEVEAKNKDLSEALKTAHEATRLKSQFLANMSHEIRTPMNGVLGMIEFLLQTELDDEQRDYAESVKQSAEGLLVIINDILDLSKIEAGKMSIESVPADIVSLLKEIAGAFRLRIQSKGLDFHMSLHGDESLPVMTDPARIRQILTNLLGNAFKFTERGSITLGSALLRDEANSVTLRFFVQDTGIGIPSPQHEHLFKSFVQGEGGMNRKFGGTGLGLAISKQFVEMLGGQIGFESEEGAGSTFWFDLPLERVVESVEASAIDPVSLKGVNVLLACDTTSGWKPLFDAWGARTEEVARLGTILPALKLGQRANRPFRLLIVDSNLSGFDPVVLRDQICSDPAAAGIRVLFVGGASQAVIGAQFDGFVQRPVPPAQFQLAAGRALGARGRNYGVPSAPSVAAIAPVAQPPASAPAPVAPSTAPAVPVPPASVPGFEPAAPQQPATAVPPPAVAPRPAAATTPQRFTAPSPEPSTLRPLSAPTAPKIGFRMPSRPPAAPPAQTAPAAAPTPAAPTPAAPTTTVAAPPPAAPKVSAPLLSPASRSLIAKPPAQAKAAKAPPQPPPGVNPASRILLAEDNVVNQKIALKLLEKVGLSADLAENGAEAVEFVRKAPYHLILMDCMMPEMDGFEATRQIRALEQGQRHTPIVAITANAMKGDRERCLDSGMDDYVSKPFDMKALLLLLDRWLANKDTALSA